MTNNGDESDFNVGRAELFDAISHPVRIRILEALEEKDLGFSELKKAIGVESGGRLSFHLAKLRFLVKTNTSGNYQLTEDGREALWSAKTLRTSKDGSHFNGIAPRLNATSIRRKNWTKPILASLIMALVVFGAVSAAIAANQQQQIVAQQAEISRQQVRLSALGPWSNGQSASIVIGQKDFTSAKAATSQDGLNFPVYVVFDGSGNMWVGDTSNNRVLEFKPPLSTGMQASLVIGQPNFTARAPATTQSGLRWGPALLGLAFDSSGNLWVADNQNNRVLEFKPPFSSGMAASIVIGQRDFTTAYPRVSRDGLHGPSAVAFDPSDNLWVVERQGNRVLEFESPFSNGMNASLVIGQPNFKAFASSTTQSGLGGYPFDLAIDSSGNLWVGDTENNRVLEFRPPFSDGMNASLVIGQTSFATKISSVTESGLTGPLGLAFDPTGNLWVGNGNRILEFQPPFSTGMSASVVIGQKHFTESTPFATTENGLAGSGHPGFDPSGNLWVPDINNHRVLEFRPASVTLATADQGLGQLQYAALGAVAVVVGVGLIAVFQSRRNKAK